MKLRARHLPCSPPPAPGRRGGGSRNRRFSLRRSSDAFPPRTASTSALKEHGGQVGGSTPSVPSWCVPCHKEATRVRQDRTEARGQGAVRRGQNINDDAEGNGPRKFVASLKLKHLFPVVHARGPTRRRRSRRTTRRTCRRRSSSIPDGRRAHGEVRLRGGATRTRSPPSSAALLAEGRVCTIRP